MIQNPDHPLLIQGRRHARDVTESAARIVRLSQDSKSAEASATLSTALQLVLSAALVDGFDPHEAYTGLAGALAWAVGRLPPEDRQGVLTSIVASVVDQMKTQAMCEPSLN